MAGTNGTAKPSQTFVMPDTLVTPIPSDQPVSGQAPTKPKRNIAMDLLPFTAVPFEGEDALYAWGRLLMYGAVAYATYKPMRNVSYGAMAAAGMCLLTSLSKRN